MIITLIIFILIFLIVVNYFQVITFASLIIGPKIKTSIIVDKWILKTIKDKTGLVLKDMTIFHDKRPYAMMAGIYPFPKLIISEEMYKVFNRDEMEWVILHEAGHCVLWHNLEAIVIEGLILTIGISFINLFQPNILLAAILSLILSILCIQIIRWLIEYQADKYSINRVTNPEGVITAQEKLRKYYKYSLFGSERNIVRMLLSWNITPTQRIKMVSDVIQVE